MLSFVPFAFFMKKTKQNKTKEHQLKDENERPERRNGNRKKWIQRKKERKKKHRSMKDGGRTWTWSSEMWHTRVREWAVERRAEPTPIGHQPTPADRRRWPLDFSFSPATSLFFFVFFLSFFLLFFGLFWFLLNFFRPGFTGFESGCTWLDRVLFLVLSLKSIFLQGYLVLTWFYLVLPGFTWFYLVLPGFTCYYLDLPRFRCIRGWYYEWFW